jgi:hypothetical protein
MSMRYAKVAGILVLVVLLASLIAYAVAQPPAGGFQGGGQRDPGMMMRAMMRGMGGGPAIAVADGAVFVVANNMLLKYDANTLELLAQAELPQPKPPAGMPAPGQ